MNNMPLDLMNAFGAPPANELEVVNQEILDMFFNNNNNNNQNINNLNNITPKDDGYDTDPDNWWKDPDDHGDFAATNFTVTKEVWQTLTTEEKYKYLESLEIVIEEREEAASKQAEEEGRTN